MCVFVGLQSTTRFVILNPIALFIYVFTSILRVKIYGMYTLNLSA